MSDLTTEQAARRHWMGVLARATAPALREAWESAPARPDYSYLRRPETGLALVRGRAGGSGQRFNLGEMTVTRCSVRLADGTVGHAYIAGRDSAKAEHAALLDALLQDPARRDAIEAKVVAPLAEAQAEARSQQSARAESSRVEFFTMVRGDG